MDSSDDLQAAMAAGQNAVMARAGKHAAAFLASLPTRAVGATASPDALRRSLGKALPERGTDPLEVIDELAWAVEGGLLGSSAGRFFGWVIGGALPVAIAADWMATAWDQNSASYALSPAEAVVEDVCGEWLKQLLGLPPASSFALVTGCQMAHVTALAAARHQLLQARGIDVERAGLRAGPPLRVLASEHRHESLVRAVRILGLGTDCMRLVGCEASGAMRLDALAAALAEDAEAPTILCLQAGELNTGAYDPFGPACHLAHAAGAWVHVDGAFGLWAAVSEHRRHLLRDVGQADSWATDGHKWLNLPYDCGFAFVADPAPHRAAFAQATSYAVLVDETRRQMDWNPEWSRRGRGFAAYAAIRALGRSGIAAMVDRCCDLATAMVNGLAALPGVEVLARPIINQALVRFVSPDGQHDARTDAVIQAVQASGTAWFGGATWRGQRVMRISVCNWRTDARDVQLTLDAVRRALG